MICSMKTPAHSSSPGQVHGGETATCAADAIGAKAYMAASHVVFGKPRVSAPNARGRKLEKTRFS